ncbi:MAG: hypothetical protein U0132_06520 [Gemmatimonadaceae bacterium]
MRPKIETEEHGAIWRVMLEGDSLPELFDAIGRFIGGTNPCATGVPGEWEFVSIATSGPDALLAAWVNLLVEKARTESQLYAAHRDVNITRQRDGQFAVEGWIRCEPVTSWSSPLRGISTSGIRVESTDGRWHAELQFDV